LCGGHWAHVEQKSWVQNTGDPIYTTGEEKANHHFAKRKGNNSADGGGDVRGGKRCVFPHSHEGGGKKIYRIKEAKKQNRMETSRRYSGWGGGGKTVLGVNLPKKRHAVTLTV